MSTQRVPSENILKLRELTERLSKNDSDIEYENIVKKLKKIVDDGRHVIETSDTQTKIKCYESMCQNITTILNNISFK